MEITGTQTIAAPRQRVWDALNDPDMLKRSLPGCESVLRITPEEFKVVVAAAIGPLRARFNGVLRMADVQAPSSCTMVFEGQGGAVGFGKGNSSVSLTETDGQTALSYTAQAQVGGKLAQVGSRLIDSVARKMADDFFKAFKAQLAEPSTSPIAPPAKAAEVEARPDADTVTAAVRSATVTVPPASAAAVFTEASPAAPPPTMVPGWWLGVAAAIGSAATLVGGVLVR
ncbi:carbon monoxide dehydrogenase subunit G [Pseudorhodoferax sp. Leaf265]|uniref:SRPBCC family protein n=1 Tax=Pseudorhodoferax sp. Leaf265 TaxID=1736315 RepID=UPI000728E122|nr:carbon monoxide dehydrogenase subunit G [Pseudorhodoferax sp. Leaf265]KQP19299.1 hypothetical protein ASF45_24770 [Pseudorhodoferax sp. Leaf265]